MKNIFKGCFYLIIIIGFVLSFDFFRVYTFKSTPFFAKKYKELNYEKYDAVFYDVYACLDGSIYIQINNSKFECPLVKENNFDIIYNDEICDRKKTLFYEDNLYSYYIDCIDSIYLKFNNGSKIPLLNAIQNKIIDKIDIIDKLDNCEKKSNLYLNFTESRECNLQQLTSNLYSYCLENLTVKNKDKLYSYDEIYDNIEALIFNLDEKDINYGKLYKSETYSILICKNKKTYISNIDFVYDNSYCD